MLWLRKFTCAAKPERMITLETKEESLSGLQLFKLIIERVYVCGAGLEFENLEIVCHFGTSHIHVAS